MKYPVTRFTSLKVALKELEPFIKDGAHLKSGDPFARLGDMRSREALANWLISAILNFEYQTDQYSFTSDPNGGDGTIVDLETNLAWMTEHVMVPQPRSVSDNDKNILERILDAVNLKREKGGTAYASDKCLVVFLDDGRGEWCPNAVTKKLPNPLYFEDVWVVGLQGVVEGKYSYAVTQLMLDCGNAPIWIVDLSEDFSSWNVNKTQ